MTERFKIHPHRCSACGVECDTFGDPPPRCGHCLVEAARTIAVVAKRLTVDLLGLWTAERRAMVAAEAGVVLVDVPIGDQAVGRRTADDEALRQFNQPGPGWPSARTKGRDD